MNMHPSLKRVTIIHLVVCFLFFAVLNYLQRGDEGAEAINVGLGWIFWLGMFCIAAPAFLSDHTRRLLFIKEHIPGTLVFAVLNIAIPIFCTAVTSKMLF